MSVELWRKLQANGLQSYREAPEASCALRNRKDVGAFREFCQITNDQKVLDVGCGCVGVPGYLPENPSDNIVGIDPLEPFPEADFGKMKYLVGVGENLPFDDKEFDRVIFATSLDHCYAPAYALMEAHRVLKDDGRVFVWAGMESDLRESKLIAYTRGLFRSAYARARRTVYPDYQTVSEKAHECVSKLNVPQGAVDPFHMRRDSQEDLLRMFDATGLGIVRFQRPDKGSIFYELGKDS